MSTTIIQGGQNGSINYNNNQAIVDATGAVKVTGSISATNPSVGPNGSPAPSQSTEIGAIDPNGNLEGLKVDSSGNLLVSAAGFATQHLNVAFNEVTSIAVGIETTIGTYTAPAGKVSYLLNIYGSGENRAQFNAYINGVFFDRQYTNVTQLSSVLDYKSGVTSTPGYVFTVGDVLTIRVVNAGTSSANYNSRILVFEAT